MQRRCRETTYPKQEDKDIPKNNESPQASEDMPKNEGMQENENAQEVVQPKEPQFGESKVAEKFLRFEQLLTEVDFPRGQTEAQTMKQLGKLFATKTGNQKLILDGIRLVKPDYAITAEVLKKVVSVVRSSIKAT